MTAYSIEAMCKAGNTTPRGIRLWEDLGFLGEIDRDDRERRTYDESHLRLARIISACRQCSLTNDDILKIVKGYNEEARKRLRLNLEWQRELLDRQIEGLPQVETNLEWDL